MLDMGEFLSLATPKIVKMITSIVASDENFEISDSFNVKHQSEYLTNIGEHSKTENKTHHCKHNTTTLCISYSIGHQSRQVLAQPLFLM